MTTSIPGSFEERITALMEKAREDHARSRPWFRSRIVHNAIAEIFEAFFRVLLSLIAGIDAAALTPSPAAGMTPAAEPSTAPPATRTAAPSREQGRQPFRASNAPAACDDAPAPADTQLEPRRARTILGRDNPFADAPTIIRAVTSAASSQHLQFLLPRPHHPLLE